MLQISGAKINVHKLLGIHEQQRLIDQNGNGTPISGGDMGPFVAKYAFDKSVSSWASLQAGQGTIASAYIGYDFGVVKIPNGRNKYAIPAPIRKDIATIKLKQGIDPSTRATKIRVERSDDGRNWYGAAILQLSNTADLTTYYFTRTVPSRFWRIRPVEFSGSECSSWVVQALEFLEYEATNEENIQDKLFMENRDRDYAKEPIMLKGLYTIQQSMMDLTFFGGKNPLKYSIKLNFSDCVAKIGRSIIIGDIIELPSEVQYTPQMVPVKLYLEVTDTSWDPESFTPGWLPLMILITAEPAYASQETRDIFGDLAKHVDSSGLFDKDDGIPQKNYQDVANITHSTFAEAATAVPERGSEGSNVFREFTPTELDQATAAGAPALRSINFNRTGLYVEDALPQNGEPYTEGPDFPTKPKNGDYHRMIYVGTAKKVPARLFRYSSQKQRWLYLETDRREEYNAQSVILDEYLTSPTKIPAESLK